MVKFLCVYVYEQHWCDFFVIVIYVEEEIRVLMVEGRFQFFVWPQTRKASYEGELVYQHLEQHEL